MSIIAVAALIIVSAVLLWWLDPTMRRARSFKAKLKDREPLSDAAMVANYFATEGVALETPGGVRRIFAKQMGYPAEKLLPDDDLTFYWYDLDMIEVVREIEAEFGIELTDSDAENTRCTIRDVSLLVTHKTADAITDHAK